jgi:hypothetical protein
MLSRITRQKRASVYRALFLCTKPKPRLFLEVLDFAFLVGLSLAASAAIASFVRFVRQISPTVAAPSA